MSASGTGHVSLTPPLPPVPPPSPIGNDREDPLLGMMEGRTFLVLFDFAKPEETTSVSGRSPREAKDFLARYFGIMSPSSDASAAASVISPTHSRYSFTRAEGSVFDAFEDGSTAPWGTRISIARSVVKNRPAGDFLRNLRALDETNGEATRAILARFYPEVMEKWTRYSTEDKTLIVSFLDRCLTEDAFSKETVSLISTCFEGDPLSSILAEITYIALNKRNFALIDCVAKKFPLVFGRLPTNERSFFLMDVLRGSSELEAVQKILREKAPFLFCIEINRRAPIERATPATFCPSSLSTSRSLTHAATALSSLGAEGLNWDHYLAEDSATQLAASINYIPELLLRLESDWARYGTIFCRWASGQRYLMPDLAIGLFSLANIETLTVGNAKLWSLILEGLNAKALEKACAKKSSHPIFYAQTASKQSLLHLTLKAGLKSSVFQMVDFCNHTALDAAGKSPLHYAIENDCVEYAIWCLQNESLTKWVRETRDSAGNFLHYSLRAKSSNCIWLFCHFPEMVVSKDERGYDVVTLARETGLEDSDLMGWIESNFIFLSPITLGIFSEV